MSMMERGYRLTVNGERLTVKGGLRPHPLVSDTATFTVGEGLAPPATYPLYTAKCEADETPYPTNPL